MHADVKFHHRALQALRRSQDQYSDVFVLLIESKLPENIRVSILSKKDQQWDIDKFLVVLGKEISIRKANKLHYATRKFNKILLEVPRRSLPATTSSLCVGRESRKCIFCYQEHESESALELEMSRQEEN